MQCLMRRLMLVCVGLSLSSCASEKPLVIDSFCRLYEPVIVSKGDGAISATPGVKRRLLVNELNYKDQCK